MLRVSLGIQPLQGYGERYVILTPSCDCLSAVLHGDISVLIFKERRYHHIFSIGGVTRHELIRSRKYYPLS